MPAGNLPMFVPANKGREREMGRLIANNPRRGRKIMRLKDETNGRPFDSPRLTIIYGVISDTSLYRQSGIIQGWQFRINPL